MILNGHMNISVIGSKGLAKELGKKGSSSDIILYNTSFQGKHFTFIEPEIYPEKIQTLFQSMNMSQFVILYIKKDLPKNILGECIIAADMLKKKGMIVLDEVEEDIKSIIKGTSLKDFPIIENNTAKILDFLSNIEIQKVEGKPKVVIDHFFVVKSVGTIALGTVFSGEVRKYDKLTLFPLKKEVMVKSIQIHDKDYEKAGFGERVGLSIKGVNIDELKRGYIISDNIECIKEIKIKITKNIFFKEDDPKNVMCVVGLQYVRGVLEDGKIVFENEVAYDNEWIVILIPEKKMRIFGLSSRVE